MKKLITLITAILLMAGTAKAKDEVTTLWEGTFSSIVNIEASNLKTDGVVTVYFSSEGASLKVYYNNGDTWDQTALPSKGSVQWFWQNSGVTSYSFSLSSEDMTALTSSANGLCIDRGDEKLTITKITLTETLTPSSTTTLLSDSWTAEWSTKTIAAQSGAKLGDVILFHITHTYSGSGWDYSTLQLRAYGGAENYFTTSKLYGKSSQADVNEDIEFELTTVSDLEKIQNEGFGLQGSGCVVTSIELLTYSDSYDAVSITVGSDGIATYSNASKNVQISSCNELQAYYASAVETGKVTLTELTGCIPANQGVMIYGTAGTYTVPVGGEGWLDISSSNYLKATGDYSATVTASTTGTYRYIFSKKNSEEPAFYYLEKDHTLAAHKAYLETGTNITPTAAGAPRRITLDFGNGTTAVLPIENDFVGQQNLREDGVYYTLQGTRVQNPSKGLYILNGKKVLVK